MSNWTEGALALIVVVALGAGLFLFTGETLGETGDSTPPITIDPAAAARGEVLAEGQGCLTCHTTDGRPGTGPTFQGLAGSVRPLTDGSEVVADDAYIFNSIVDPSAAVVAGFDDVMPKFFADQLDETQVSDLVEYVKSLAS